MNYKTHTFIILIFLLLFNSISLMAASTGSIVGKVYDNSSNESLPGCSIVFKGTVNGTVTDGNGKFTFLNVKPGSYTLQISFMGYISEEVEVSVVEGKITKINIGLYYESILSQEVVVSAQAEGQVKAINQQINAESIVSIVSEARIKELPDANAAEALGRLSGVTINRKGGEAETINIRGQSGGSNTYAVEGMRMIGAKGRGVELSNISSSMIGGIELQKSFTPDNDGDVSGGGVKFKLKEADEGLHIDIFARQGYNGLTKSFKMRDFSVTAGDRFFNNKLGIIAGVTYDVKDRSQDALNAGYTSDPYDTEALVGVKIYSGSFARDVSLRKRLGLTYNIDYTVPQHKIKFNGFLASMNKEGNTNTNYISKSPMAMRHSAEIYTEEDNSYMFGLSGEHDVVGLDIEWGTYYSGAANINPGTYSINGKDPYLDIPNWDDDGSIFDVYNSVQDQHVFDRVIMEGTGFSTDEHRASEFGVHADIKKTFQFGNSFAGYIKTGIKYRRSDRIYEKTGSSVSYAASSELFNIEGTELIDSLYPEFNYWRTTPVSPGDPTQIAYGNFATDSYVDFIAGKGTKLFYPAEFDQLIEVINRTKLEYQRDMIKQSKNYNNKESLKAAYIMSGLNIGKYVVFTPGVRFESYESVTDAFKYVADPTKVGLKIPGGITPVSDTSTNSEWLPMFTLKVKPVSWFDIRASVTKTLIRPSFLDMSPRSNEDYEFNRSYGNPLLKPEKSKNYDLYFSFYENFVGLFTIGGFYKDIDDKINRIDKTLVQTDLDELGLPDKYLFKKFSTYENNEYYSYIKGIEVDWQTRFWYLPSFLNGFIFSANYTLLNTETKKGRTEEHSREIPVYPYREKYFVDTTVVESILESPNQTLKFALGYENKGFSGRISLLYQSRALSDVNRYRNDDVATDAIYRLDLQLSQKVTKNFKVYLNVNNLTNMADINSYFYFPDKVTQIYDYGWSMDAGLRYQF